jgi:anti-sigma B factor antagonist
MPLAKNTMPLEIQIQRTIGGSNPGAITVKLSGSLDPVTVPELERRLSPVLAGSVKDLVFDLAQLKFITSAGLRVFAVARRKLLERGGQPAFVNLQPPIKEVFDIIKALPREVIFESEAELDAYLAARQQSYEQNN